MKKDFSMTDRRPIVIATMVMMLFSGSAFAQGEGESSVQLTPPPAEDQTFPAEGPLSQQETARAHISYYLGILIGEGLKKQGIGNPNFDYVFQGVRDSYAGRSQLSEEQLRNAKVMLDAEMKRLAERFQQVAEHNDQAGQAFRDEYAQRDGVQRTDSGLLYRVIDPGAGSSPTQTDTVRVTYSGTHIDGTQFLQSTDGTFVLKDVRIEGLRQALHLMKPGATWELVIAPALAFGASAQPNIGPNSTIIVELTLHEINPPPSAEATQP
jgi:FKBP-type peptidyl-prolyl cis-trans isomerase